MNSCIHYIISVCFPPASTCQSDCMLSCCQPVAYLVK